MGHPRPRRRGEQERRAKMVACARACFGALCVWSRTRTGPLPLASARPCTLRGAGADHQAPHPWKTGVIESPARPRRSSQNTQLSLSRSVDQRTRTTGKRAFGPPAPTLPVGAPAHRTPRSSSRATHSSTSAGTGADAHWGGRGACDSYPCRRNARTFQSTRARVVSSSPTAARDPPSPPPTPPPARLCLGKASSLEFEGRPGLEDRQGAGCVRLSSASPVPTFKCDCEGGVLGRGAKKGTRLGALSKPAGAGLPPTSHALPARL